MTSLLLTINRGPDAKPDECGTCEHFRLGWRGQISVADYCNAFFASEPFVHAITIEDGKRCQPCLAAEAALKAKLEAAWDDAKLADEDDNPYKDKP